MTFAPPPPTDRAARSAARAVALCGATGVLLLAWIALADADHAGRAALAAVGLAALTLLLHSRARRAHAVDAQAAPPPGGAVPVAASASPLRDAFDALPDPLMIVSGEEPDDIAGRRIVLANAASRGLFRIPAEGALLVTVLRDPEVLEIVDEALYAGVERQVEFALPGVQDRHWRAETRPLPSADDHRKLAVLHLRDETETRRMNQMRADFLANASHELRSPLASLSGFIETLKGPARDDAPARDRFLDIMAVQADRMGRLIADLLSLSRIELNEHVAPAGAADLALVAGDVIDALTPTLRDREVQISLAGAQAGEARVAGDRDQIVQVVQNLVDNAVKYSPKGSTVEIEILPAFSAADALVKGEAGAARHSLLKPDVAPEVLYAAIRVRDRGKGIAREHLPRLSERFYRVEGQKSGDRLGTGLGLAIVKHIVNRHRGGLVVESTPGQGASFTAYLPSAVEKSTGSAGGRNKSVMQAS